ncbi:HAMP domain-containing histidine kinase (plasmid) [Bacillus mycoides]|uniref:sensor histidine kinase n=1 Tax=Bacillus mycoides TaxID=1405 RepID=UPI001C018B91|nr:HAMP domain-containing sensor histidine kinase [Bacillus mycoides]NUC20127.1 HAMP domain-containing histidine kinase [Bacillus mycoides]QWG53794.1 HAMP domain-containing histidine kinase [Bacillus mycoides]QWG59333.1 HAMP domain-containing histidine kinase [Bacillus mycoides]QWG75923.1 HAMP domain-containing histidine kinase [Bacillus mycoides]QWH26305.1 HAMP domain-containing histidine kinase [Bacillus mycoides]
MRKKIVFQLFFLTFLLCCMIIAVIFFGQMYVMNYLYIDKEKEHVQKQLQQYNTFYEAYKQDENKLQNKELSYENQKGIMIARLDEAANIKKLPSGDYYIKAINKNDPSRTSKVVFNNLINAKKDMDPNFSILITSLINKTTKIAIMDTASKGSNKDIVIPTTLKIKGYDGGFVSPTYYQIDKIMMSGVKNGMKIFSKEESEKYYFLEGIVKEISFPVYFNSKIDNTLYSNEVFANRILQFQSEWITDKVKLNGEEWVQNEISINGIKYLETIKPILKDGQVKEFIYSLSSLQPITKATDIMSDYYVYIIAFVLVLSLIVSFYYSRIITKPLLKINEATKKIMEFEFEDQLSIKSKNEIGELSSNINQLSERMEGYINQLKEDLEKEKQLEQTRKDFIAGVSHELKTPLSVMQVSASMLQDGFAPEMNQYYWEALEKEIEKMNILIDEMLNLAKYESGTYQIQMEQVSIGNFIQQAEKDLHGQIDEKSLQIKMNIDDVRVKGKANLLEQVITNLFTNAIRYTDARRMIVIEVIEEEHGVYIGFENKGSHIAEENIEKIWDQFYRVDKSRKRVCGGTGLGLSIVKNIFELHAAEYGVTNTEDGVLFYFRLEKWDTKQ